MAPAASSSNEIAIDVTKDLKKSSDLFALFKGQAPAIFRVGSEVALYKDQPIRSAVGSAPAKLTLQGDPNWKTSSGIAFSLKADASCTIAISDTSTKFPVAMDVDSKETTNVLSGPTAGMVYINIELDFDIKGALSGSGNVSGIGIEGKSSGSKNATLSYCHPVSAGLETAAALKAAFDGLIFPFRPDCALSMPVGSIGKVNFDGTLDCELDVLVWTRRLQIVGARLRGHARLREGCLGKTYSAILKHRSWGQSSFDLQTHRPLWRDRTETRCQNGPFVSGAFCGK